MPFIKNEKKLNYFIFLGYFLAAFLLYLPVQDGKFVNDTYFYIYKIEKLGFLGFLKSYDIILQYQVPSFFYYFIYKVFGFNWLGWNLVFTFSHALTAFLVFYLINLIVREDKFGIAFWSAAFFLVSPFQTEAVAWGATLHYLLILNFLLWGLICIWKYFKENKKIHLIYFQVSFFGSLFCYEQAYMFPLVYGLFYWIFIIDNQKDIIYNSKLFLNFCLKFIATNFLIIGFHTFLNRLLFNSWIGHYGAGTHLEINKIFLLDTVKNYFLRFVFLYRYLPDSIRSAFVSFDKKWITHVFSFLIPAGLLLYSLLPKNKNLPIFKLLAFSIVAYFLMLAPVINLDNSFTFEIQSDRYGYPASLFFYIISAILIRIIFEKSANIISAAYMILMILLLIPTVHKWQDAGKMARNLVNNFHFSPNEDIYILNLPDNHNGAYVFRNGFVEALTVHRKQEYSKEKVHIVSMVNTKSFDDETMVENMNDSTLYVKCAREGKWYYIHGGGAHDYETEDYQYDVDEWNFAYTLKFKKKIGPNMKIVRCIGDKWVVIDSK